MQRFVLPPSDDPGRGLPIIAQGLLFSAGYRNGAIILNVLNASTGDPAWSYTYPAPPAKYVAHEGAIDYAEGRIFQTWSTFGPAGQVTTNTGYVYAFNASTGQNLWKSTILGFGSDFSAVVGGIVLVSGSSKIEALNASTGAPIWNANYGGPLTVSGDLVFVGPLYSYLFHLYVLALSTGTLLWDASSIINVYCCFEPLVAGGLLFLSYDGGGSNPEVAAVNLTSRSIAWISPVQGVRGMVASSNLIFTTGDTTAQPNTIYALNQSTGNIVWSRNESGIYWGVAAYADGLIFASNYIMLEALNASNGTLTWSYAGVGSGIIAEGRLYAPDADNIVVFADGSGTADFELRLPETTISWYSIQQFGVSQESMAYIPRCQPTQIGVGLNSQNGFDGNVTLQVTGLPASVNRSWSANPVRLYANQGVDVKLSLTMPQNLCGSGNHYSLTITATSSSITHSGTFQLTLFYSHALPPALTMLLALILPFITRRRRAVQHGTRMLV